MTSSSSGSGRRLTRALDLLAVLALLLFLYLLQDGARVDTRILGIRVRTADPFGVLMGAGLLIALRALTRLSRGQALLLVGSSLFSLLILEAGLRLIDHPLGRSTRLKLMMERDPLLGYRMARGLEATDAVGSLITVNSAGFRGQEVPVTRRPGTFRIMGVGDSFTFGVGVAWEHTLLQSLHRELGSPAAIETVNAGAIGYNLYRVLRMFEDRGRPFLPDLVIYFFYSDDFVLPHDDPGMLTNLPEELMIPPDHKPPRLRCYVINFLSNAYKLVVRGRLRAFMGSPWLRSVEARRAFYREHGMVASLQGQFDQEAVDRQLKRLADSVSASGGRLLVALIPDAVQVGEPAWQEMNRAVARMLTAHGIAFVDMTPAFEKAPDPRALYLFPYDAHTSAHGNRLIAQQLAPLVRKLMPGSETGSTAKP